MVINPDGTKTSSYTVGGVTTTSVIDKDGKVLSKTTSKANPSGSSGKSTSGEKVASVDYMNGDGTISTLPKSMAEAMDRNRTDGKSGIVAGSESWDKMTLGADYRRGGTSANQQTMYEVSNKNTGEKKVIYSNYNNYLDAFNDAGLLDDWKLDRAVTYRDGNNKSKTPYVSDTGARGGFADTALKQMQAAEYLYGSNANQLTPQQRAILQGIIDGTVSTAGVNFGDATSYEALKNGSTSRGTYDGIDLSGLKNVLDGMTNSTARKEVTDDMMTTAEYQTYANSLKGNTAPTGSTAPAGNTGYTGDVNLYNGIGGYGDMNFNVGNNYGVPAYNGLTADDIKEVYGSIWNAQEQQAANNTAFLKSLADSRRDDANKAYDETARQAWVQSMINQNNLPQMLKAQGLSGGASESSQLAQQLNYENIINNNETDRANALRDIDQSFFEAQTEANNNLLQIQAGLQQDMLGSLQSAMNAENAFNQWVAEYNMARTEADRDYALKQAQLAKAEQEEAEARALQMALTASEFGDFSQLQALGIDTAGAQKLYNADLTKKTTRQKTQAEIEAEEAAAKEAAAQASANELLDAYTSKFETTGGQEQAVRFLQKEFPDIVTDARLQNWLNSEE